MPPSFTTLRVALWIATSCGGARVFDFRQHIIRIQKTMRPIGTMMTPPPPLLPPPLLWYEEGGGEDGGGGGERPYGLGGGAGAGEQYSAFGLHTHPVESLLSARQPRPNWAAQISSWVTHEHEWTVLRSQPGGDM